MRKLYNGEPVFLGTYKVETPEYFTYTYLPIKMADSTDIVVEDRLQCFNALIGRVACDFVGVYGLDRFVKSYLYLTAKHACQRPNQPGFNRPGWHSDGFGTADISYIWSNAQPTLFNTGEFWLSDDDILSMKEMEEQADEENSFGFMNNSLIRMDQTVIHRVGDYEVGERMFMKLVFSEDEYKLRGNSINHLLTYDWDYIPRRTIRNVPQTEAVAA